MKRCGMELLWIEYKLNHCNEAMYFMLFEIAEKLPYEKLNNSTVSSCAWLCEKSFTFLLYAFSRQTGMWNNGKKDWNSLLNKTLIQIWLFSCKHEMD